MESDSAFAWSTGKLEIIAAVGNRNDVSHIGLRERSIICLIEKRERK